MHLDRQRAGELITDRVRAVAGLMRVTEPTARKYLDDETIRDMARRMLFEFVDEQPGADLMEVPRTVPLALVLVGIIVAALAEAMQVRAANEPSAAKIRWGRCRGSAPALVAAHRLVGQLVIKRNMLAAVPDLTAKLPLSRDNEDCSTRSPDLR